MQKLSLEQLVRVALQEPNAKEYEEYMTTDISSVVVPAHVDRKIKRDIRKRLEGKKPLTAAKVLSKIALVALIAMSIMFVTIMAYGKTREAVIRAFVEWRDNFIAIRYEGNSNDSADATEGSSEKPTETGAPIGEGAKEKPSTIEEYRKPSYIPPDIIEVPVAANQTMQIIEYYAFEEELAYMFEQHIWTEENKFFDNKGATIEEVIIGESYIGTVVTYAEKEDIYLVWGDEEYIYVISSYLISKEEMIDIANSVKATSDPAV